MKRVIVILFCLFLGSSALLADNETITRDVNVLPTYSREFISTYFNQSEISHIKIEKNLIGRKNYDVILTDGTNLEFDQNGDWTEVDSNNHSPVPSAIIPVPILSYIQTNFKGKDIVSIEKEPREVNVKLSNGLELTFNKKGKLIEIDD